MGSTDPVGSPCLPWVSVAGLRTQRTRREGCTRCPPPGGSAARLPGHHRSRRAHL